MTDRKGALQAFRRCRSGLGRVVVGEPFAQGVRDVLSETVAGQIAKRSESCIPSPLSPSVGCGAQLCLIGEESTVMEKLRA
jgi:hypothetical protein